MKYEVDKVSGYLRVDRPQRSSAQHPSRCTASCRAPTAASASAGSPPAPTRGDGDPLDICVLSERAITRNEIIVRARVIGGLQMVDRGEADDKIISVLDNDYVWGEARDLRDLPAVLIERLQHYFLTYRLVPGEKPLVEHRQGLRPRATRSRSCRRPWTTTSTRSRASSYCPGRYQRFQLQRERRAAPWLGA